MWLLAGWLVGWLVDWLVGWLNLLNAELSQSEEVLARTEMPGGRGRRETIPNTTLSPPGRLLHYDGQRRETF